MVSLSVRGALSDVGRWAKSGQTKLGHRYSTARDCCAAGLSVGRLLTRAVLCRSCVARFSHEVKTISVCRYVRVPYLHSTARLGKSGVTGRNRIPARERNRTDRLLRELSGGRLRLGRVCPDVARARRTNPARAGAQTTTSTRWRLCGGGGRQAG